MRADDVQGRAVPLAIAQREWLSIGVQCWADAAVRFELRLVE